MGQNQQKKPPEQPASEKMFDNIFEFKMMAKSFAKESTKSAAQEKVLLNKVKEAIAKGDYENAKVIASDAIRKKNEVKRYHVLSSKIDTISQRLENAYKTQQLTENMKNLTEKMVGAGNAMDMVQINQTMSNFEKMFDDLDVNSEMMNQVFDGVNAGTTNENEVNNLVSQVAQENGLKIQEDLDIKSGSQIQQPAEQQKQKVNVNNLP